MFNMWPNIVVKVPMVVLVYCIGKILSCWSVGQQFYASTIWLGGHLGSGHRTPSPNCSLPPTIVYSSSELRLIRKIQPKQSLDHVLWGRLGDLGFENGIVLSVVVGNYLSTCLALPQAYHLQKNCLLRLVILHQLTCEFHLFF